MTSLNLEHPRTVSIKFVRLAGPNAYEIRLRSIILVWRIVFIAFVSLVFPACVSLSELFLCGLVQVLVSEALAVEELVGANAWSLFVDLADDDDGGLPPSLVCTTLLRGRGQYRLQLASLV